MPKKLTKDEFLHKSLSKFGEFLDYSEVEYKNSTSFILLTCPVHGAFKTTPNRHMNARHPCPKCSKKIYTVDTFIGKAKKKHNNKYFYNIKAINKSTDKITIQCPNHGNFEQIAANHLFGSGCPKCANNIVKNTKTFIREAHKIHKNKYDYCLTKYSTAHKYVTIICKKHGEFQQSPANHLSGKGCPKCANKNIDTKSFIQRAVKIHGKTYDYSLTKYINNYSIVKIICKKHGVFKQRCDSHLNGSGCQKCWNLTFDDFCRKSSDKFGNVISFDNAKIFSNVLDKITITCKEHGDFTTSPYNHLKSKKPCPKCSRRVSSGETEWLDYIGISEENRNFYINIDGKRMFVDGYCPSTNTVYEFNGDYWHGNPKIFVQKNINKNAKKTFGALYEKTIEKERLLRSHGFDVISIWESDWNESKSRLHKEYNDKDTKIR